MTSISGIGAPDGGGLLQGRGAPLFLGSFIALSACSGSHHTQTPDANLPIEVTDGAVKISPTFDDCPTVVVIASPKSSRVGEPIAVSAIGSDDDSAAHLTYAWSATAGTFASTTAAGTVFTCPGTQLAGPQTITVAVSDGKCGQSQSITVSCYAAAGAGGSGGAVGNGGGGAGGSANNGGVGGSMGIGGMSAPCPGDRTTCEGTLCNQCTFGVGPGEVDLCDSSSESCFNCIVATDGCAALTSDDKRTKCENLYLCLRDNKCVRLPPDGSNADATPCWCGTTDSQHCTDGTIAANGPCVQQVIDAAESSDPQTINLRFISELFALGRAVNLATCRKDFCGVGGDAAHPSCPLW
jgi:hypothetical protein